MELNFQNIHNISKKNQLKKAQNNIRWSVTKDCLWMSKVNHNIVAASVFSEDIKVVFVIVEEEFVIVEE